MNNTKKKKKKYNSYSDLFLAYAVEQNQINLELHDSKRLSKKDWDEKV